MFFREIISGYSENHMKLCGQNAELFNVKASDVCDYDCPLKD
jgi:hypothetical protein